MTDVSFQGLSHVDVPVTDLARAKRLYGEVLGFPLRKEGTGWADIDAGTAAIRLVETRKPEQTVAIRVQAASVEEGLATLAKSGARLLYTAMKTPANELVGSVRDPDGNTIYVWRPLTEDEYETVPELPKELTWTPEAEAFLKSLLKHVPALFRGLARRRVVAVAEELAGMRNLVTKEDVIRGFILGSPRVTRGRNREPLVAHGVDVDKYQADWDAD